MLHRVCINFLWHFRIGRFFSLSEFLHDEKNDDGQGPSSKLDRLGRSRMLEVKAWKCCKMCQRWHNYAGTRCEGTLGNNLRVYLLRSVGKCDGLHILFLNESSCWHSCDSGPVPPLLHCKRSVLFARRSTQSIRPN